MTGGKRKDAPSSGQQNGGKKKKTGNSGKWKTPHHQGKQLDLIQPGDQGIWVTCARHKEAKALREVSQLFSQYLEKMYGIKETEDAGSEDGDVDDIEAAVQKEVAALSSKDKSDDEHRYFTPVKMNVDCLLFVRTKAPIEPLEFARRICADAKAREPGQLKCRYVNRLTPVTVIGKASEAGLLDVARKALSPIFKLIPPTETTAPKETEKEKSESSPNEEQAKSEGKAVATEEPETREYKPSTFAIRPQIRNHSNLKRDQVIVQTAGLVDQAFHKVNLTSPDYVILIDIYQTACGMSVVGRDWEELKKYNLSELYGVSTDEAKEKDS
ncbi:hypothetical protein QBC34DRAFT_377554 [Podospora aff. communis PSN243]|uniref:THUMP domain-containing protein n=1 Tax=Podospora aff. communis PSN243 TaxID=3040156 RepID=A0AAV9GUV1_9PEZI|nr:hypothetical protein QBC34DRAFT_377554 [Podospora aff. communis PSN243]